MTSKVGPVVTVCVGGRPARERTALPCNKFSGEFLLEIASMISVKGWAPKIVLFPGGYFYLPRYIGHLTDKKRKQKIDSALFSKFVQEAAKKCGALIVAGVDTKNRKNESFDQLCVGWNKRGVSGIGRKIFPVGGEEASGMVVYKNDFETLFRVPKYGTNKRALLCACYDGFGINESDVDVGRRAKNIEIYSPGTGERVKRDPRNVRDFRSNLKPGLKAWSELVKSSEVALVAIHYFSQNGAGSGKTYWQRYGIQKASKTIAGRLTYGAAHFELPLPPSDKMSLTAKSGKIIQPVDHFALMSCGKEALVRLFE